MGTLPKVFIASDCLSSGLLWDFRLHARNIDLAIEPNLSQVVQRCVKENPALIVVDLNPLNPREIDLISELREVLTGPLLILHSIQNNDLVLKMYEAGADDCIHKTIEPNIFLAKINAWLNRSLVLPVEMLDPLRVGPIHLISSDKLVSLDNGFIIHLTNTETRLLYVLMSRSGHTIRAEDLIQRVWMEKEIDGGDILKSLIYRLRRKLETEPANLHCILTISGIGYKFDPLAVQGAAKEGSERAENW